MAKGFEFVEDGPLKETVADALDDAKQLLETIDPEHPDGLSVDAYMYGLEGRRVTVDAAQDTLSYLGSTGLVSFSNSGRIQFPPRS